MNPAQYELYGAGAGVWAVQDTAVAAPQVTFAAFDGVNTAQQFAALLNAGTIPAASLVWQTITITDSTDTETTA